MMSSMALAIFACTTVAVVAQPSINTDGNGNISLVMDVGASANLVRQTPSGSIASTETIASRKDIYDALTSLSDGTIADLRTNLSMLTAKQQQNASALTMQQMNHTERIDVLYENVSNLFFFSDTTSEALEARQMELAATLGIHAGNITTIMSMLAQMQASIDMLTRVSNASANEIIAITDVLNEVVAIVDNVTDCSEGGVCVPAVATCPASLLSNPTGGRVTIFGDHGAAVPVGTQAEFTCNDGFYADSTSMSTTCQSTGWTPSAPRCLPCTTNCSKCTGSTADGLCTECSTGYGHGYVLDSGETFDVQVLDTDAVRIDLVNPGRLGRDPSSSSLETGKHMMVFRPPASPGQWTLCPDYNKATCADTAWVQVDLGRPMRIGDITVWHYYGDPRRYCNQKIAVSPTGLFLGEETVVWAISGYGATETSSGYTVSAHGITGRYVRHWSSRSTRNVGVHFLGFRVAATDLTTAGTPMCMAL